MRTLAAPGFPFPPSSRYSPIPPPAAAGLSRHDHNRTQRSLAPGPRALSGAGSRRCPPPGARAQAQGPRDLRSRGPTARCCASRPGRGFGPGPLTHPTIAQPKSWCFVRAAAATSPRTRPPKSRRRGRRPARPAFRPYQLPPPNSRGDKMAARRPPSRRAVRRGATPRPGRLGPAGGVAGRS